MTLPDSYSYCLVGIITCALQITMLVHRPHLDFFVRSEYGNLLILTNRLNGRQHPGASCRDWVGIMPPTLGLDTLPRPGKQKYSIKLKRTGRTEGVVPEKFYPHIMEGWNPMDFWL